MDNHTFGRVRGPDRQVKQALALITVLCGIAVAVSACRIDALAPALTMTPTKPTGVVLLTDDFSDARTGAFGTGAGTYVDGEYSVVATGGVVESALSELEVGDVGIEADVRLIEPKSSSVIMSCRVSSTGDYSLAVDPVLQMYRVSDFRLSPEREWSERVLVDWRRSDLIRGGVSTNRIGLYCVGTSISAWVNGRLLTSVQDDARSRGQVSLGFGGYEDNPVSAEARFDNFALMDLGS